MSTVIVTGGAGFLGSHLCKRLLDEEHTVICIDNLISGSKKNIEPFSENPQFTFVEFDVVQPLNTIKDKLQNVTHIFHLASPASPNAKSPISYMAKPIETLLANSVGTYNFLQLAQEKNASFLFTSTSEVYGNPNVSPQPESYFGNVNPNGVRSVYDEAKRFGEAMTFGFRRKFGVNARIVRLFNTFGPNMQKDDGRVVSTFINQALENQPITIFGDGNQTRSFGFVSDTVDGIVKAIFTDGTDGQVMNLGNPDERKVSEIATMIKELVGSASSIINEPIPEDDPMQRRPDITKAKQLLGWEPKVSLEEGLKKTIEYFKNA